MPNSVRSVGPPDAKSITNTLGTITLLAGLTSGGRRARTTAPLRAERGRRFGNCRKGEGAEPGGRTVTRQGRAGEDLREAWAGCYQRHAPPECFDVRSNRTGSGQIRDGDVETLDRQGNRTGVGRWLAERGR